MKKLKVYIITRNNYAEYDEEILGQYWETFIVKEIAQAFSLIATIFDFMHLNILKTVEKKEFYYLEGNLTFFWTYWADYNTWSYFVKESIVKGI